MRAPVLLIALSLAAPAAALDRFEIQVYHAESNAPGELGVELHLNYTFSGTTAPDYPGQIPLDRLAHYTIEPAVGLTEWLELGGYFQLLSGPGVGVRYGGMKVRAKMVVPQRYTGHFSFGLNVELGRVPSEVEEAGWANEFRPIIGWSNGTLLVDVNPIFGYALSGKDAFRVDLEPCAKVAVNTQLGFALGFEYYASLGFANELLPLSQQEHVLLGVFDLVERTGVAPGPWELNLGFGGGLTAGSGPKWIAKAIVGRSF